MRVVVLGGAAPRLAPPLQRLPAPGVAFVESAFTVDFARLPPPTPPPPPMASGGTLILLTKGADEVLFPRLAQGSESDWAVLARHLELFASQGLRTLAVAGREVRPRGAALCPPPPPHPHPTATTTPDLTQPLHRPSRTHAPSSFPAARASHLLRWQCLRISARPLCACAHVHTCAHWSRWPRRSTKAGW
jgi:hypothetical protein